MINEYLEEITNENYQEEINDLFPIEDQQETKMNLNDLIKICYNTKSKDRIKSLIQKTNFKRIPYDYNEDMKKC